MNLASTTLYRLYTRVDEANLFLDPVVEALSSAINDLRFRFNDATYNETYSELLSRLSYRIDLICKQAQNPNDEEQYQEVHDEVYDLATTSIQGFSEEEHELDYIPF